MKSLDEILKKVRLALIKVSDNVGLYEANDATKTHIIYAPDNEPTQVNADNRKQIQTIQGTIDLYALKKDTFLFNEIQESLNKTGISFYLNSVQYEDLDKNNFIHFEWVFEVS